MELKIGLFSMNNKYCNFMITHLGRLDKTGGKVNGFAGAGALGAIGAGTTGALY